MYTKNGKRYDNNKPARPRNETMAFKFADVFTSTQGVDMDRAEIIDVLNNLNNDGVFSVLSTPVQISRSLLLNDPERRGNMNVGFIQNVNVDDGTLSVTIYATSIEKMKELMNTKDVRVAPRILAKNDEFLTFLSFDFIVVD